MKETELNDMQRLLEIGQGPLEKIREQQDMIDRVVRPALPIVRMLEQMQLPNYAATLADQFKTLNRQSALFEATQSIMVRPAILEQIESITKRADEMQRLVDRALLPDRQGIAAMADTMANRIDLFKTAGLTETAWSRVLRDQMAAIQTPWLDVHLTSLSFEGFAVISRLGQAVRYAEPFDAAAREQIDEDLGDAVEIEDDAGPEERDAAHIEAGMNASMLAISPAAIGDVLIETGFVFKAKFAPLPATTDGSDPGHVFHPGHNMIFTAVEQNLRAIIDTKMQAEYGATWMDTRINPSVVQGWIDRRGEAVAHGENSLPLIQYSNFMELKDIVVRRQHWRDIFKAIFKEKEHFQTSMDRLHPIRHPLAHSRPIGIAQQYHLISEASIILRALGINIFED